MESEALDAFFTHVTRFATVPVYFPNVSDEVAGQPVGDHFRVSVFRTTPESIDTCGGSRYIWILQVAIYVRDGVGPITTAGYADAIRHAIPAGTRLITEKFSFQTADPCAVISPLKSDGWFITPVQCRFFTID